MTTHDLANHKPTEPLSEVEEAVLRGFIAGLTRKEMSALIRTSPQNIANARTRLCKKIGVRRTALLIRWGCVHGYDTLGGAA